MKHTPIPWKFNKSDPTIVVAKSADISIAFCNFNRKGEDEANAEFIVRACNSHEELLEAYKGLVRCCRTLVGDRKGCLLDQQTIKVQQLIAKAEGKE